MITRTLVTILALALTVIGVASRAAAQNGYSFSDARARRRLLPGDGAAADGVPRSARHDRSDMSIVSAEIIPAAAACEHCRVNGLLVPEIRSGQPARLLESPLLHERQRWLRR